MLHRTLIQLLHTKRPPGWRIAQYFCLGFQSKLRVPNLSVFTAWGFSWLRWLCPSVEATLCAGCTVTAGGSKRRDYEAVREFLGQRERRETSVLSSGKFFLFNLRQSWRNLSTLHNSARGNPSRFANIKASSLQAGLKMIFTLCIKSLDSRRIEYNNKHCEVLVSCSDQEAVKSCQKLS